MERVIIIHSTEKHTKVVHSLNSVEEQWKQCDRARVKRIFYGLCEENLINDARTALAAAAAGAVATALATANDSFLIWILVGRSLPKTFGNVSSSNYIASLTSASLYFDAVYCHWGPMENALGCTIAKVFHFLIYQCVCVCVCAVR